MVAKGLDFEDVTLVGVLGIDSLLFAQGFRAYETCSASSPRWWGAPAGRKTRLRHHPDHRPRQPVLNLAAAQDYDAFFEQEIAYRKLGLYPPFCGLCVVGFSGRRRSRWPGPPRVLGPLRPSGRAAAGLAPAGAWPHPGNIEKINENYRYKLTIKCRRPALPRPCPPDLGLYEQEKLPARPPWWWICILTVIFDKIIWRYTSWLSATL